MLISERSDTHENKTLGSYCKIKYLEGGSTFE